jgi:hypothetical protein
MFVIRHNSGTLSQVQVVQIAAAYRFTVGINLFREVSNSI